MFNQVEIRLKFLSMSLACRNCLSLCRVGEIKENDSVYCSVSQPVVLVPPVALVIVFVSGGKQGIGHLSMRPAMQLNK